MKVMTIVGTRPEIIKLSCVVQGLNKRVDHVLVHTGQNYDHGLKDVFFQELGLRKPKYEFYCAAAATSTMGVVGNILDYTDNAMAKEKPDAVLLLGDTNSALSAYAAKRRHIPVFHMEAGNRCFDQRVPEEINRKLIDHMADINMPYTEHARRNLLAEGLPADRIIKTGSPMREVLFNYADSIHCSKVLEGLQLKRNQYFVVSAHREENVDSRERLEAFIGVVNGLVEKWGVRAIVSLHPRTEAKLHGFYRFNLGVELAKPFGFFDYVALQRDAACVISDSGTLTEEAGILGFPAVMIRQAHERPEGMEEGVAVMADLNFEQVNTAVEFAMRPRTQRMPADYAVTDVSHKVVNTILSYTDYVRRNVYKA